MENSIKQRLERMIAFRNAYTGNSNIERHARSKAVKELWAYLPTKQLRNKYKLVAGL